MAITLLDGYVSVPDSGYACLVRRNAGTWRSFTITSTENNYYSSFMLSFVTKAVAAYPSEVNLTGSIINGFTNLKTGAAVTMSLSVPSEVANILGYASTSITNIIGTAGRTATYQSNHYLYLPRKVLMDDYESETINARVNSDTNLYTTTYGIRRKRELKLRFTGFPRSTSPNEYAYAKAFYESVVNQGKKVLYYPDAATTTSVYNEKTNPYGYEECICEAPNDFKPDKLVSSWDYHHTANLRLYKL